MEEERMNNEVERKEQPEQKISGWAYIATIFVYIIKKPRESINLIGRILMIIGLLASIFTDGEYGFFCLVIGMILAFITWLMFPIVLKIKKK